MSSSHIWLRQISVLAEKYKAKVITTRKGHLRLEHKDGWFVTTSRSPSDYRALHRVERDLKRKASGVWR